MSRTAARMGPAIVWMPRKEGELPSGTTADGYSAKLRRTPRGTVEFTVSNGVGTVTRYRESILAAKRAADLAIDDWREQSENPSVGRLLTEA